MAPRFEIENRRVFVAGSRGMVGRALVRRLAGEHCTIVEADRGVDLREQAAVRRFMAESRPDVVVVAAAKVGGILANATYPADFLYDNLMIEANLIHAAFEHGAPRLLFLGSSCIYPRLATQPLKEESLLTGPLEPTNEWYAIAKIAGIKLCQAYRQQHGASFISAMPTNLYGPHDNFSLSSSHVIPALMRKIDAAKRAGDAEVVLWGTGTPRREFLHVDDLADALVFLLKHYDDAEHINVGVGDDVTISELAATIARIIGYDGRFVHDISKPDGTPRKLMDVSRLSALGWKAGIGLEDGLASAYRWFLDHQSEFRQ